MHDATLPRFSLRRGLDSLVRLSQLLLAFATLMLVLPIWLHGQGLGGARERVEALREAAEFKAEVLASAGALSFVQTLHEAGYFQEERRLFEIEELRDSLAAMLPARWQPDAEHARPSFTNMMAEGFFSRVANLGLLTCLENLFGLDGSELIACHRANREAYSYLIDAGDANEVLLGRPEKTRDGCACCCADNKKPDAAAQKKQLLPLFSIGEQLFGTERRGEVDLAAFLSTNLPNSALSKLVGGLFETNALTQYIADDLSLDMLFVQTGAAAGRVLTGLSFGGPKIQLDSAHALQTHAFIRSIPDQVLDPLFLEQSRLVDADAEGHATLGIRLDLVGIPKPDSAKSAQGQAKLASNFFSRFSLSLELSGIFVTQGNSLGILKDVFTIQDPDFRSTESFQINLSLGYWFWGKK